MLELPELTPEHFEILVMRELRKIGLDVSELRTHRRSMLPEPERGYLLELKGVLRRPDWQRRTLIACRRQQSPIGSVEVESLKQHLTEAEDDAGVLFGAADFDPAALTAAEESPAAGQVSIFHLVPISRDGRPAILVQRFDGPTADTAVQAGLWASKQLGRR